MTRIHILSDLHLEFGKMPRDYAPPECDVVVLAGDIATGVQGVMWAAETFSGPVIYIPGNHEFYGKRVIDSHIHKMKEKASASNVHVLSDETISLDGVKFICSTLWTDFNLYGTQVLSELAAQRGMNDFYQIMKKIQVPLSAYDATIMHQNAVRFIEDELRGSGGKAVVVTHHAPSERSVPVQFAGHSLSPAFASNLEWLMRKYSPKLWVHGHTHDSFDYRVDGTRVVCNPRGYVGHLDLNPEFNPGLVVEV